MQNPPPNTAPPFFPRYDIARSYEWNYDHAPPPVAIDVLPVDGEWSVCGCKLPSPLAIAAGPLLNGRWILYYASLGFDLLTYKTVRSQSWPCYPLPNLLPVRGETMSGEEERIVAQAEMRGSWAISFGMPSKAPDVWREDVRWTRDRLDPAKKLAVSVVATVKPDWSMQRIADDYARCALWAVESGADLVEINLSCPNVSTRDGQLYQHPVESRLVAQTVKAAIGQTPLLAKVGYLPDDRAARELLHAVADDLDGLIMVNGLATQIVDQDGAPLFDGQLRGVGGDVIRPACVRQLQRCRQIIEDDGVDLQLVGCGGVTSGVDLRTMLDSGAQVVQMATAPMHNPSIGLEIRQQLAR